MVTQLEKTTITSKVIFYTVIGLLAISLLVIGVIIYWLNAPYDPLVFRDRENKPTKTILLAETTVPNGGYLELLPNFCKTIDGEGEVEAEIVGAPAKPILDWPKEQSAKRCYPNPVPIKLPIFLTDEPRRICFHITYHPNPVRTVEEYICTEEFRVKD